MLQTYEAIYSGNQIRWINQAPPEVDEERRVVVVMNVEKSAAKPKQNIHEVLERTRGAWGKGKTRDEIDAEINIMRSEWERKWD
jgi:hypothetical protein